MSCSFCQHDLLPAKLEELCPDCRMRELARLHGWLERIDREMQNDFRVPGRFRLMVHRARNGQPASETEPVPAPPVAIQQQTEMREELLEYFDQTTLLNIRQM